eukprot:1399315-Pyramimonas_sp.AAC.1
MEDGVCIARTLTGWWRDSFVRQMCIVCNGCQQITEAVPHDFPKKKLQRRFLNALIARDPVDLADFPEIGLLRRISSWLPAPCPIEVAHMIGKIRYTTKRTKMYIGLAPLRIACR